MAIPGLTGNGHKISISELGSVTIIRTMLFSKESIIIESFVLKVTLACVMVNGMDVRCQEPLEEAILLVSISKCGILAGR